MGLFSTLMSNKFWVIGVISMVIVVFIFYPIRDNEPSYYESWTNPPPDLTSSEYLSGDYSTGTYLVYGEITYLGGLRSELDTGLFEIELDNQLSFGITWDAEALDYSVGEQISLEIVDGRYSGVI